MMDFIQKLHKTFDPLTPERRSLVVSELESSSSPGFEIS